MYKVIKKCIPAFLLIFVIGSCSYASAKELLGYGINYFNKVYVDSNTYGTVSSGQLYNSGEKADVQVDYILDSKGHDAGYKYVWCRATRDGKGKKIMAGRGFKSLTIPYQFRFGGSKIDLQMKGADPSKDCLVTGQFITH